MLDIFRDIVSCISSTLYNVNIVFESESTSRR